MQGAEQAPLFNQDRFLKDLEVLHNHRAIIQHFSHQDLMSLQIQLWSKSLKMYIWLSSISLDPNKMATKYNNSCSSWPTILWKTSILQLTLEKVNVLASQQILTARKTQDNSSTRKQSSTLWTQCKPNTTCKAIKQTTKKIKWSSMLLLRWKAQKYLCVQSRLSQIGSLGQSWNLISKTVD